LYLAIFNHSLPRFGSFIIAEPKLL